LNRGILSGSLAFDASVIIEMLLSSDLGKTVEEALMADSAEAHSSEVNLAEAEYVLCRKLGPERAKSKLDGLRKSNYLLTVNTEHASRIAAEIKCSRGLALADCYTLATAKVTGSRALFTFRERELQREMKKRPCDVEVIFLEDLMKKT